MKKILSILLLTGIAYTSFGQADQNRFPKTPLSGVNQNKASIRDYNLTAVANLRVPVFNDWSLRNAKDSAGYVMFNSNLGQFGGYNGSEWIPFAYESPTGGYIYASPSTPQYAFIDITGAGVFGDYVTATGFSLGDNTAVGNAFNISYNNNIVEQRWYSPADGSNAGYALRFDRLNNKMTYGHLEYFPSGVFDTLGVSLTVLGSFETNYLKLNKTPLLDALPTQVLTRDATTGEVKYVPSTSFGGGGGGGSVTNVSSANSDISVANPTTTPVLTLNSGTGANQIVKRDGSGNIAGYQQTITSGTDGQVVGYLSGTPTPVTLGLTQLSDIAGIPSFSNGVYAFTGINPTTGAALRSFIEFSTTTPKAGTFPTYGTGGILPVSNGVASTDAVNVSQLAGYVPTSRTLNNGYGINAIGNLSANRTVSVDTTTIAYKVAGKIPASQLPDVNLNPNDFKTYSGSIISIDTVRFRRTNNNVFIGKMTVSQFATGSTTDSIVVHNNATDEFRLIDGSFVFSSDFSGDGGSGSPLSLSTTNGTGAVARSTSPTFVTPTLGAATATSINKVTITAPTTNATLTLAQGSTLATAGAFSNTITTTANTTVTFPTTGTLYGTATGSITSAQLLASLSNETGTGVAVFGTSPTIATPNITWAISTKTGAYTVTSADYTLLGNATTASFTITLPAASTVSGKVFNFKKIDSSANTVTVSSASNIDGSASKILSTQYSGFTVQSDGTVYHVIF